MALFEQILGDNGAYRIHGGGFAGTILAFLPEDLKNQFESVMSGVFGTGCCHFLNINREGGRESAG